MKVIGVIGRSGSGKTTVLEKLIACYREWGYTVGTLKDLKKADYSMDMPGKNTARHKAAGADPVTARGERNTDVMFTHKLTVDELLRFYDNDIVLLEGFRDLAVPQLLTGRDEAQLEEKLTPTVLAVSGVYAAEHEEWRGLPCYDVLKRTEELARFLLEKVPDYEESLPTLYRDGEVLPLSRAARLELRGLLGEGGLKLEYK